jgi:hypothetical protein
MGMMAGEAAGRHGEYGLWLYLDDVSAGPLTFPGGLATIPLVATIKR